MLNKERQKKRRSWWLIAPALLSPFKLVGLTIGTLLDFHSGGVNLKFLLAQLYCTFFLRLCQTALHFSTAFCCTLLHFCTWNSQVNCTILHFYCILLHLVSPLLYALPLYCTLLHTVLHFYTAPYCTLLHFYCTWLYHTSLQVYCSLFHFEFSCGGGPLPHQVKHLPSWGQMYGQTFVFSLHLLHLTTQSWYCTLLYWTAVVKGFCWRWWDPQVVNYCGHLTSTPCALGVVHPIFTKLSTCCITSHLVSFTLTTLLHLQVIVDALHCTFPTKLHQTAPSLHHIALCVTFTLCVATLLYFSALLYCTHCLTVTPVSW